ncbi:hypothetical protein [Brevundimonas vesicularis]|uniref:hypothetical protein n=1 Tax=Brevundimonas vesicularis TaxID=41276 RepID=UPI0022ABCFE6|nr:hypothetical protein [Brevundimonas vesicularis]
MKNLVAALTLRFVDRLSGPSRGAVSAIGQLNRAQDMGKAASKQWSAGLEQLDEKLNRLASASLITDGIGRAGQAMIRPLRAGVAAAAEFGQGMTGIGITAEMTDRQLQPMRKTILDTAAELGALPATVQSAFSSVLAEGVYKTEADLTRAGRSVAKFQALAATMKDPISGDEAGGLSAGLARSFNVSADRLDQANAMLNLASKRGGVGIGVAARFLPAQAASMRGMGGNSERGLADLMAATQVAKSAAGGSEQAANNLSNLLGALTSPETLRNFSKMGVNLEREIKAGLQRGISPLETAAVVTNRLTKGGDQYRLGELFGDRQAREGMMALVQDLKGFQKISTDLRGDGVLQAYYADLERAMQGPAASFGRYASGMARLGIATGTILAPAVGAAADALTRIASWMSNASEKGGLLAKAAVWAFAGLAAFAVGAGAVGHAVVGILGPLLIAKTLMGGMGGAAMKAGAAQVIGAFARMRMAAIAFNLSMLANPVVLGVVAAVAAVALVAVVVRKYWQPIKAFFGGVGQALGEAFGPALTAIGGALRPLKPLWDAVAGAVGRFFGWIGRLMQPMQATKGQLDGASNAGRNFGRMLVLAFNLSPIGIFARGVMTAFRFIQGAMNWRPMETLRQAWAGVNGFFGGLVTRFNGFGRAIMQGLIGGVRAMLGEVAGAVIGVANGAVARFKGVLGIKSPSRVFAALGGYTMEGLTQGLDQGAKRAVGVMTVTAGAMTAAMAGAEVPPRPLFGPAFEPPMAMAYTGPALARAFPGLVPPPASVPPSRDPSPTQVNPPSSAMPAVLAALPTAPAVASADARGRASNGVHIDQVLIQVSIPAGADAARQGGMAGRAAADSFRARLYDGLNG